MNNPYPFDLTSDMPSQMPGSSSPARCWGVALEVCVKINLEEMQLRLSDEQKAALIDGIGKVLKVPSPRPNGKVSYER